MHISFATATSSISNIPGFRIVKRRCFSFIITNCSISTVAYLVFEWNKDIGNRFQFIERIYGKNACTCAYGDVESERIPFLKMRLTATLRIQPSKGHSRLVARLLLSSIQSNIIDIDIYIINSEVQLAT